MYERVLLNSTYDQSLQLNGTTQYAKVATAVSPLNITTNQLTLGLWCKTTAFQTSSPFISNLISNEFSTGGYCFRFGDTTVPNNSIEFQLYIGGNKKMSSPVRTPVGVWSLKVGVYDGVNMSIYDDGILSQSAAQTGNIGSSTNPVYIGREADASARFYNGAISNAFVIAGAMSATDIQKLYNLGPNGNLMESKIFNSYTIAGHWPLNGIYSDLSTNANTLSPNASPTFNTAIMATDLSRVRYVAS